MNKPQPQGFGQGGYDHAVESAKAKRKATAPKSQKPTPKKSGGQK